MLNINPMVTGYRLIISIGYKYTVRKVLYLIFTEYSGSTKAVITYLSKYRYQFDNVFIISVAGTLVMSKFFGYVN